MELIYKVKDRPPVSKLLLAAFQQVLAVLAGTIAVPLVVGNGMSQSAALFGAGIGTLVYLLITKFRCPVFLGSSFSFVGSMLAAFAGATSMSIGYVGLILGAAMAGLIYVILGIIVKFVGTKWIDIVMPPVIIGPVVATIGLVLAPNAVNNIVQGGVFVDGVSIANPYICLLCGLVALFVSVTCSVYGKKLFRLIPFIIGIFSGYLVALIFTLIGRGANIPELQIIDFSVFSNLDWHPDFAFVRMIDGFKEFENTSYMWSYIWMIAIAYIPVALVTFAEHIADHKNLSFIVGHDFIEDPGLHRTLMGDGTGSMIGAFFGGCPNTTYGESISCVAISKNASIWTILCAAGLCIVLSFIGPLMAFFQSIPSCVVGGLCFALYGYIALSGLQMLKKVDLTNHKNIFIIASIFVAGIGGLTLSFDKFVISPVACALAIGILMNFVLNIHKPNKDKTEEVKEKEDK